MFSGLLENLFDKEQIVSDTIQDTLERISVELGCPFNELFVMIKPYDSDYNFKCYIYSLSESKPKLVREIPLSEILGKKRE